MKFTFLFLTYLLPVSLLCQVVVEGPWTIECGASTNTVFKTPASFNVRYISPRFKWSEEWSEEEEKHPGKFKRTRVMMELIYRPTFKVFCTGFTVQYSFIKYKRLSLEACWGMKLFFVPGGDFATIRPLRGKKGISYFNEGLLCQFNLGMIAPFADIGYDGIITIGTELNFHAVYLKPKKRYKLHLQET
jgi:hypothetical protein